MQELTREIDALLAPLPVWIGRFRDAGGRFRYHRHSPVPYCLYATMEGLSLAELLGAAPPGDSCREDALAFMRDCQSAVDGYFRCPTCTALSAGADSACLESNRDGLTFKVATKLMVSGVRPAHPLPEGNKLTGDVEGGLERIFLESNPYGAGSQVWKKSGMYGLKVLSEGRDPMGDGYMRRIMEWLIRHQDPETGLWYPKGDFRNAMNGLLKMRYGTFDLCGVAIPNAGRAVDTILSLPSPETGRFGEACDDWNGVGLLADLGRRVPGRRADILAAYRRILPAMRAKTDPDGGFTWGQGGEAYLKPTFINAVGLLAMKAFVTDDAAVLDDIFFLKTIHRKVLG